MEGAPFVEFGRWKVPPLSNLADRRGGFVEFARENRICRIWPTEDGGVVEWSGVLWLGASRVDRAKSRKGRVLILATDPARPTALNPKP